jgi:hypothetical protein
LKAVEWEVEEKGVREHNGRGWTDQSKVYSQQGYIEKLLWTLSLELITKDRTVK